MKIIGKFRNPILIYVSVRDDAPSAYIEVNIRQLCNNQVGKLTIHFVLRFFSLSIKSKSPLPLQRTIRCSYTIVCSPARGVLV